MDEPRDLWSKAEILCTAIGAIVLPIALFLVGTAIANQQEASAEQGRQAERLTGLLQPLASENPRERRLAIEVIGYLAQRGQLPGELIPVLVSIVGSEGESSEIAQKASAALARVEEKEPELRKQIQSDIKALQPRVYFHINDNAQRATAERVAAQLTAEGLDLVVPGIERVNGPERSELRFFKRDDAQEAARIAQTLERLGVRVAVRDLSRQFESSDRIRPRHFELWLGNDFRT